MIRLRNVHAGNGVAPGWKLMMTMQRVLPFDPGRRLDYDFTRFK